MATTRCLRRGGGGRSLQGARDLGSGGARHRRGDVHFDFVGHVDADALEHIINDRHAREVDVDELGRRHDRRARRGGDAYALNRLK